MATSRFAQISRNERETRSKLNRVKQRNFKEYFKGEIDFFEELKGVNWSC